jgi:hypothetical protein
MRCVAVFLAVSVSFSRCFYSVLRFCVVFRFLASRASSISLTPTRLHLPPAPNQEEVGLKTTRGVAPHEGAIDPADSHKKERERNRRNANLNHRIMAAVGPKSLPLQRELESEIATQLKMMEGLLYRAEIRRRACVWVGTELRRGTRNGVVTGLQVVHAERVLSRTPYTRFPPHMILPYRSVAPVLQERDIELDQPLDWSEVGLDAAARTQLWAEWARRFLPANQQNILPIAKLCRVDGAAPLKDAKKAYDLL